LVLFLPFLEILFRLFANFFCLLRHFFLPDYPLSSNNSQLNPQEQHNFRLNCLNFYIELAAQIKDRSPFGNELYSQLTWLDPRNIFSDNKATSIIPLVRKFANMVNGNAFENINTEWRLLSELPVNKFSKDLELEELVHERISTN
jgi:hypothetical protein